MLSHYKASYIQAGQKLLNHVLGDGYSSKCNVGNGHRTPSASSLNHVLREVYSSKGNIGNRRSDAFGVLDLIMYWDTGIVVNAMLGMDIGRLRRPRLNHVLRDVYSSKGNIWNRRLDAFGVLDLIMYWGTCKVGKAILGMDARTPSASSIYHVLGDGYISKCNVGNKRSDAFGVLDLTMYWGTGTVVKAMLRMDARTPSASTS